MSRKSGISSRCISVTGENGLAYIRGAVETEELDRRIHTVLFQAVLLRLVTDGSILLFEQCSHRNGIYTRACVRARACVCVCL